MESANMEEFVETELRMCERPCHSSGEVAKPSLPWMRHVSGSAVPTAPAKARSAHRRRSVQGGRTQPSMRSGVPSRWCLLKSETVSFDAWMRVIALAGGVAGNGAGGVFREEASGVAPGPGSPLGSEHHPQRGRVAQDETWPAVRVLHAGMWEAGLKSNPHALFVRPKNHSQRPQACVFTDA